MLRILFPLLLMFSASFASATSYNDEIEIEFGESILTLVIKDEGDRSSYSSEEKIFRSNRVLAMSIQAPKDTYFDDEEKAQLILTLRHKCDFLGESELNRQQTQLAQNNSGVKIVEYGSEIPDSTLVLSDDYLSGRCHIDIEAE